MIDKYRKVQKESKKSSGGNFRLEISINTVLHVDVSDFTSKIKVELLGIKHNEFLIANLPHIIDSEFVEKCNKGVDGGPSVICRYVYKGCAYGFRSKFLGIITKPIEIMVFQYPDNVEECNLRRYERLTAVMPARIKFGTEMFYGSVKDISEAGCQLAILNSTLDKYDLELIKNTLTTNMSIMIKLPGIEKDIVIPAIRRNVLLEKNKLCIGAEFNKLDMKTEDMVKRFIIEMHKHVGD